MKKVRTVEWKNGRVVMLDQRLLPNREVYRIYKDPKDVIAAIRDLVVRGAPAIGVAAAMGLALGAQKLPEDRFAKEFEKLCRAFAAARPTAVNLFWAIERMRRLVQQNGQLSVDTLRKMLEAEAIKVYREDLDANRRLSEFGAELLPKSGTILTHCNAGGLATAGIGTALGVILAARDAGKKVSVFADETRPVLQGARLTAWELKKARVPVTVITDNMAGHFMQQGKIDAVVVGTDRTAANGDVANKIGTYTVAVLAARHGIPFYVAAPDELDRSELLRRFEDPNRGALARRGESLPGQARNAEGREGREPRVRRDTREARDGDHHGERRRDRELPSDAREAGAGVSTDVAGRDQETQSRVIA